MLPEKIRFEIGERVREVRVNAKLSQMKFAESVDISTNFLSEIENGKKGFSSETLYNICDTHHIPSDYILFGPTDNKKPYEQLIEIANPMPCRDLELSIDYLTALLKMKKAQEEE